MKKFNAIDLFCGAGGLSLGFQQAGFNIIVGVDNEQAALDTFEFNHKGAIGLNADLSKRETFDLILKTAGDRKIDVVIAGPPCQGFSLTGPRNFDDPRNKLYLAVIEMVKQYNPSLEPEYFCSLIELFYKERNGEKREIELNKSLSDRLYEILFQFKVIPGIDWNGNFDAKRFDYWMKTVKTWSRDNDRYEVAMHTVGSGLSYAELDEDKLPQTAIIEELNRVENEELRRGYYLGIINQRGVHWIDPEGKPELELAEDYENRANIAESRGYSRYADILRVIADEFKREAKRNILEARNGDDE